MRRYPERLIGLALVLLLGAACVWVLFRAWLPVAASTALLLCSAAEFLLPVTYTVTSEGVSARGTGNHSRLSWAEGRRCLPEKEGITLTPLDRRSRLDAFRGVTLRFAPVGRPGDRASVLAAIAMYAPHIEIAPELLPTCAGSMKETEEHFGNAGDADSADADSAER